jgi:hypothetical protein
VLSETKKIVSLSSCESEFVAATAAAKQALWLRNLISEITKQDPKPVTLFVDNNSAIALMKNPVFHGRSKHIDLKYHFIRECVERGQIVVKRVGTEEQKADILTKASVCLRLRGELGGVILVTLIGNTWSSNVAWSSWSSKAPRLSLNQGAVGG